MLASLWRVEDEATAELMQRFYRHLRAGKPKDEARRAAQLELIRRPLRVPDGRGAGLSATQRLHTSGPLCNSSATGDSAYLLENAR